MLPGWLGCSITGAVVLTGTAAILVGSTAILAATLAAALAACFEALMMVVMWLLHRSIIIMRLLRANKGRRGRHVGGVGMVDSFRGGNGHPAGNKLLFSPGNVNRILVDTV